MRNIAVCGAGVTSLSSPSETAIDPVIVTVPIEDISVDLGLLHTPETAFNFGTQGTAIACWSQLRDRIRHCL